MLPQLRCIHLLIVQLHVSKLCLSLTANVSHFFFFFQAEDGIRDYKVTGVQTCALPIYSASLARAIRMLLFEMSVRPTSESRTGSSNCFHQRESNGASDTRFVSAE